MQDGRCRLGLAGRISLVRFVERGGSLRGATRAHGVSPATAHLWWHRWSSASEAERVSLSCLWTRSSRSKSCPWALGEEAEQRILRARARTGYGLAGLVGFCRGTIWKVLHRHGVSLLRARGQRQSLRRYEWAQPGALLHQDTKRLQRFEVPGHWATGDRTEIARNRDAGYVYALMRAAQWMREQAAGRSKRS